MDDDSDAARDRFYVARADALNAYALLEKSLALIFARIIDTDARYATLIISKIVNTRARNEVVQRIIDMSTVDTFKKFTDSLFRMIGSVDGKRNNLVHWYVDEREGQFVLRPTDLLSKSAERMTEDQIDELAGKSLFLARVINRFDTHLLNWSSDPALHKRFLAPLRYPPEPDDPLFQHYKDIPAQLRSSRA